MADKYKQQGGIQFKTEAPAFVYLLTVPGVNLPHISAPKRKGLVCSRVPETPIWRGAYKRPVMF